MRQHRVTATFNPWMYPALAGGLLIDMLHPTLGLGLVGGEIATWSSVMRTNTVLAVVGTSSKLAYAADGSLYFGKPLPQSDANYNSGAGRGLAATALTPPEAPVGTRPWLMAAMRIAASPSSPSWAIRLTDSALTQGGPSIYTQSNNIGDEIGNFQPWPDPLKMHVFETGYDPTGVPTMCFDGGTEYTGGAAGGSITVVKDRVSVGCNVDGSRPTTCTFGTILFLSAQPSAAVRANLRAAMRAEGNFT